MGLTVEWTAFAESQLKDIFDYYLRMAGEHTARRLVDRIVVRTDILENHPKIGPFEELLVHYPGEFRYLVQDNYKIIYRIEEKQITIVSVFDCRQNPKKMDGFARD